MSELPVVIRQQEEASKAGSRFFSLRWKLLGSLVLLSLIIFVSLSQLFRLYLLERNEEVRRNALPLYSKQIDGLIRQERRHLEQVAITLPTLSGVREPLSHGKVNELKKRFDRFWSTFQLDMGLESAHYFGPDGKLVASWGGGTPQWMSDSQAWNQLIRESTKLESPSSMVLCHEACSIYAFAPVLIEGHLSGVFAIEASMAEMVLTFHNTSNADLAIIGVAEKHKVMEDHLAKHWGIKVLAASSPVSTLNVLQQTSKRFELPSSRLKPVIFTDNDNISYELAEVELSKENKDDGMRVLVIKDISRDLAQAKDTALSALYLSFLGGGLSLILLYVLLGKSLNRLLKTSQSIPLLGQGAFAQLRNVISPRKNARMHDEIDVLDSTAIMLSWRLQSLETEVEERTRSLQTALVEVYKKNAFVNSLLDHAQVVIVTHDETGAVISVNRYGRELTGFDEDYLRSTPILGSPLLINPASNLGIRMQELAAGRIEHLRHEASLRCFDGTQRDISWIHTRLNPTGGSMVTLLAVGLDITERKQNEARLIYLADHDPLTGCFNRRRFVIDMELMLMAASDASRRGCLLFVDLDHFKFLNDTSGHHAGDNLLLLVTEELRKLIRPYDILGRLGGDEFALGLLDADENSAIATAENINKALRNIIHPTLGIKHPISASIGIAMFPDGGLSVKDLLVHADIAMYQAKDKGRNGWHIFSPNEKARERLHEWLIWEERIKRSMAEDTFELYFQPVMLVHGNSISHFEILLRIRMPDGSIATPVQLLDIAERSNLIRELDVWIVRKALNYIASLPPEYQNTSFTINLSGVSIGDESLLVSLKSLFEQTPVDPSRIIFEITETAAVADLARAREFVMAVKSFGCCFALDDFGSGFSSFYYLKHFPVDFIKIDGSFIFNLEDSLDDQILVRAMVEIAKAYNKKSVAEFVENEGTLKILRQYGIDYVQGYFIGKPAPVLNFAPDFTVKK